MAKTRHHPSPVIGTWRRGCDYLGEEGQPRRHSAKDRIRREQCSAPDPIASENAPKGVQRARWRQRDLNAERTVLSMATCRTCQQEMQTADTCTAKVVIFSDGTSYTPIRWAPSIELDDFERLGLRWKRDARRRCHDCGVAAGGVHHPGCDQELCPKCNGQLIGCDCSESVQARLVPADDEPCGKVVQ